MKILVQLGLRLCGMLLISFGNVAIAIGIIRLNGENHREISCNNIAKGQQRDNVAIISIRRISDPLLPASG